MKNFIMALLLILGLSSLANAECANGTCRAPVRNTVKAIVAAPVVVTKKAATVPARLYHKRKCTRCH